MNCLDCLDRTNTVQSFLALEVCPRCRPACAAAPASGGKGPAERLRLPDEGGVAGPAF